jgi:formiminotetrahydrofolate cyclodeaminase
VEWLSPAICPALAINTKLTADSWKLEAGSWKLTRIMSLTHHTLLELLAAFRSSEPTPGGGSASALAGAIGASLLAMVAGLPKPRAGSEEDAERLHAAGARSAALSDRLAGLVDRDSEAYDGVVAAFRLPKGTDEEKAARSARIQAAMQAATEAPLEVMRACGAAIEQGAVVARFGNTNASSDVQVGLELLGAGARGARLNVEINLGSLKDADFAGRARQEAERLAGEAESGIAAARGLLTP